MLQSLNVGLYKTNKSKLWKQAFLYSTLVEIVKTDLAKIYPQFQSELQQIKVFYRTNINQIEVRLVSENTPFLTWLKTECSAIETCFIDKLTKKNLLEENQNLILKCLGR